MIRLSILLPIILFTIFLSLCLLAQAPDTLWTKTYGGSNRDEGYAVRHTSDSGYTILGMTESFGAGSGEVNIIKTDSLGNAGIQEKPDLRHKTKNMKLQCHPKPFTTATTITLSLPSIGHSANGIELTIYDASGRLVKPFKLETNTCQLGTELKVGIYFLKLNGKAVGKVVKVR